ncbi:MAG: mechanosensitive ion channel family protein [Bacteroides sp.]|nr:mechanosensitive ion channel family protein [Bacteroides sp.]
MSRYIKFLFLLLLPVVVSVDVCAQSVIEKAGRLVKTAFDSQTADSILVDGEAADIQMRLRQDSLRIKELTLMVQEMKLNEIILQDRVNSAGRQSREADSLKRLERLREIDSLRRVTKGVPVVVENDTVLTIFASMGGRSAIDRAESIAETIVKIGNDRSLERDSVYALDNEMYVDIMYGDKVIMSLTEQDALWEGVSTDELAGRYVAVLGEKIDYLRDENSFWQIVRRGVLFVGVLLMQYLTFKLINFLFRRLRRRIIRFKQGRMKAFVVRDYELLNTRRLSRVLIFVSNVVRCFILLIVLVFTVPILFAIFPQTENLAMRIFFYIIDPIKMVLVSVVEYVPNLFIIVVIWYCVRYLVKGCRYIASEIENDKLRISGFYPEWAQPTFNIVRFLLYAFMIAMIYPYLPGAHSGVFQGISVFVGLIVSLGSSTVISNFIAGFVITYMRPFKTGDFIKVKDTLGNVIEKTPFVTRLRTIKNEVVTIPNSFIMSSDTVNYSSSARQYGLIVHTVMTMGYDVPWRRVHSLLIEAALHTPGVAQHPLPFVLETELNDNYMCYQINAYIHNADNMPQITSDLLQNIQDNFHEAGIDLVAPHFYSSRDNSSSPSPSHLHGPNGSWRRHDDSPSPAPD